MRYMFDRDDELREELIEDDERTILAMLHEQGREAAERWSAHDAAEWARGVAERPEKLVEGSDLGDEWFLEDADRKAAFIESFRDAVRQGAEAMAPQFVAQVAPWGFRLEDLTIPSTCGRGRATGSRRRTACGWSPRGSRGGHVHRDDVGHAGLAKYFRDVLRDL